MHRNEMVGLLLLTCCVACQTTAPPSATSPTPVATTTAATASTAGGTAPMAATPPLEILPDVPQRLSQLPRTPIDYDRSLLSPREQQVVGKLIEASKLIDDIYIRQVSEDNPAIRARLVNGAGRSALEREGLDLFDINKGRWDRLKEDAPFISQFGAAGKKPDGAAFYPTDMTKAELESYVAAHPGSKNELEALLTVVRRDGTALVGIPYSAFYRHFLEPAAARLREAAVLSEEPSLRDFLTKRADAFLNDDYFASDLAWMDLKGPIEVVIGPYEVYEDNLFNYKAAFESFVTVVDRPESEKLAVYAAHLRDMERNLPEPDQYKNPSRGTDSPIRVVQEIYTAGDARRGVQTSAFNLPNDEKVREAKGSKKVLLKNVMNAKFQQSGSPIALRVLDPSQASLLSFDAYFNHTLFHELSHGLGPGFINQPGGQRVEVRIPLKNLFSTIEECKADVVGLWNIFYALDHGLLSGFNEQQLAATYTGLMFRSMRFGINEAHGRGTAVQWNWFREKGFVNGSSDGHYSADSTRFREAVRSLGNELLTIEATGDYARAEALLDKYGKLTPEISSTIEKLTDIPVDITPVFTAAGER